MPTDLTTTTSTGGPVVTDTDTLTEALRYALLGLRVIPIKPGGKYPQGISDWQHAATTDPDTITNWWTGLYRHHGVGIVTGAESGVWALDVDVSAGKQGKETLAELTDTYGKLPVTALATTGSGGAHLLFRWDPEHPVTNQQGHGQRLGPGLDVRGTGGQILVAPTIHPNGHAYRWQRHPSEGIAEAPGWIYGLYELEPERPEAPAFDLGLTPARHDEDDSAAALVTDYYHFPTLLRAAGWTQLGNSERWVRPGKSPRDGHSAILHDTERGPLVMFSTEVPAELANAGKPTADGSGLSLSLFGYVAATVHGGDRSACARSLRTRRNEDLASMPLATAPTAPVEALEPSGLPEAPGHDDGATNRFIGRLLDEDGLGNLVPPEPLLDGWLFRASIAFLIGPPKKGKTFVALDLAMAIATGTEWVGGTTTQPGKVLYVLGEGVAGIHSRVQAWRSARDVWGPADITFLPVAVQLKARDQLEELYEACLHLDTPDLIIIDTFARAAVGVDENSSKEMGEVIAGMDRIKEATGACVQAVHHTGKDPTKGYRGSSALEGAWDTAWRIEGDLKAMKLINYQQKNVADGHAIGLSSDQVAGSVALRRLDQMPADDVAESPLAKARAAIINAVGRGRADKALTLTEWRDRVQGVRVADIKPAFLGLVDDGWFTIEETQEMRSHGRSQPVVRYRVNPDRLPL